MSRALRLGAVLLAAGAGRRFGTENKLLHPVEGVPLIDRVLSALPPSLFDGAAVVSTYPEILDRAKDRGYLALHNRRSAEGQATSVRLGLSAFLDRDGVLFAVSDQPFLSTESIKRLMNAFAESPDCIHALSWQGQRGNPVIFPKVCFPALMALTGDVGGGAVIRAHPELLRLTEASAAAELRDVDHKSDL